MGVFDYLLENLPAEMEEEGVSAQSHPGTDAQERSLVNQHFDGKESA